MCTQADTDTLPRQTQASSPSYQLFCLLERDRLLLKLHLSKCCVCFSSFVLTLRTFTSQGIEQQAQCGPLDSQGCGFSWAGERAVRPGWVVRGQTEERGDQMCFPDKITLVPAPLTQNTHRYQLARGRQWACQPPPQAAGRISLCLWMCVCVCFCDCVCICRCSLKTNKKQGKTNKCVQKTQTWNRRQTTLSLSDDGKLPELFVLMHSYEYRWHIWLREHAPSHLCWVQCTATTIKSLCALLAKAAHHAWW